MLTILINTCAKYGDVLRLFNKAFNEHWADCTYPILLNTDTYAEFEARSGVTVRRQFGASSRDDWGARLSSSLGDIQTPFVLSLYDDFVLEAGVADSAVRSIVEELQRRPEVAGVFLTHTGLQTESGAEVLVDGWRFGSVVRGCAYRLNSAPAVWRTSTLRGLVEEGDTPWAWEVFGGQRKSARNIQLLTLLNEDQPEIYPYDHEKGGAVYRGKWVTEVVRDKFTRYDLVGDPQERGFVSKSTILKRNWNWKLRFIVVGFRMIGLRVVSTLLMLYKEKRRAKVR